MRIVVLSGAGISAESGIATFRDANGLWEGHDVMQVASPQGWAANPALVLEFYNQRRRQLHQVQPNPAHLALAALEQAGHELRILTQNVDDLHERAGSKQVLHLHGELLKVRSTQQADLVLDWPGDLQLGDLCPLGSQLRPHIVWFGEAVPLIEQAIAEVSQAELFIVIGTSLQVYPAAGLLHYAPKNCPIHYLDANPSPVTDRRVRSLAMKASQGLPQLIQELKLL